MLGPELIAAFGVFHDLANELLFRVPNPVSHRQLSGGWYRRVCHRNVPLLLALIRAFGL